MTTLTDVEQDYDPSPRVSVVLAPRTQFVAQDVVDTLRKIEDSWRGMTEPKLLDAAGKEDLGGFNVGITYALQDNQIQFEDRQTPAETGSITTASVAAVGGKIRVIDAAADFVSANVERGSFIVNWDDQSIVSVHRRISATELEVKVPTSGIANDYGIGDAYSVFNVERVFLDGGNATAVDTVPAAISPVVPSVGTYVFLTLSSSATSIESLAAAAIQDQIEQIHGQVRRSVFLNSEAVVNGNGYQQTPYNDWSDAIDNAETLGLQRIEVEADTTLDRKISNFTIEGINLPTIDLAGFDMKNAIFTQVTITGAQGTGDSPLLALTCNVLALTDFNGSMLTVSVQTSISIADGAFCLLNEVIPTVAGVAWTLDMGAGGAASTVQVRNLAGGVIVTDMDNASDTLHLGFIEGQVTIDATCTAGTIFLSGTYKLINNGTSTVDTSSGAAYQVFEQLVADHTTAGTFGEWIGKKLLTVAKFIALK